ncbi:hypothetical protein ABLN87_21795 [Ruegeria sp. SCPT10]|uniref:hypothetical protein n=1 Tax=Ruegeria sp. SCP10 TaxID=3141377 RepID=UPI003334C7C4
MGDLDDEQLSFVEHDSYLPNLFGNARGASVSDLADPMQEAYLRDSGWASFSGSPDQDLDGFPETVTVPKGYMSEIEDSDGSETLTEASLRRLDREYSGVWQAVRDQNEWLHQRLAVDLSSVSEADLGALSDLGSTDSDSFSNADFGQREAPALAPASFKVDEPTASRSSPFTHTVARQGVGAASSSSRSWTFADPAPDRGFGLALGGSSPFGEAARNVLGRGEFSWATGGRFAPTGEVTNIPFGNDLERPERPRNSGSDPVDRELDDWLPAAAKSLQEEDDFALAQRLQQEEDDSALAQRLQQEEDDSALAQRLQQQEVNFAARGAGHRR